MSWHTGSARVVFPAATRLLGALRRGGTTSPLAHFPLFLDVVLETLDESGDVVQNTVLAFVAMRRFLPQVVFHETHLSVGFFLDVVLSFCQPLLFEIQLSLEMHLPLLLAELLVV